MRAHWRIGNMTSVSIALILSLSISTAIGQEELGNRNGYSILEEFSNCEHIIPRFVTQIMSRSLASCEQSGEFPKPGNCTVFFKCVQSDVRIQPLIEYCSTGYNFVNGVCVPNMNVSDCPQYTCRIPDAINQIGNEIQLSHDDDTLVRQPEDRIETVSFASLTRISTSTPSSVHDSIDETSTQPTTQASSSSEKPIEEALHSEQLMSATQSESKPERNSGSLHAGNSISWLSLLLISINLIVYRY